MENYEEKFVATKKAGILGMAGNVFLLVIKASIGFICNSQAMIADSFNSAGDIFASLMTFIGNRIASVPNDDDHNLGHGKAEYIFSMFISIAMFDACCIYVFSVVLSVAVPIFIGNIPSANSSAKLVDSIVLPSIFNSTCFSVSSPSSLVVVT